MQSFNAAEPSEQPPTARRAVVIINARSGRLLQTGKENFRTGIEANFLRHGIMASVEFVNPGDMEGRFLAGLNSEAAFVTIAGGDGTINAMLGPMVSAGKPVAILPLGTLNLLGRDLGLVGELAQDIDAIVGATPRVVSLGLINGRYFHSNAGLGILGVMAGERENARRLIPFSRHLSFALAALRTFFTRKQIVVEIETAAGRETHCADALLVTNNAFEGTPWHRAQLDTGMLEIHLLSAPTLIARLRMLVATMRGYWREHPFLKSYAVRSATIRRRDKQVSSVAIDGELHRISGPIRFEVARETCQVYAKPVAGEI